MRFRPKPQQWKRTLQGWKLNISLINPPAITDTRITQWKENDTSIYTHQTVVKHLSNTNFLQNSFSHILQWWSRGALLRAQALSAPKASVRKTKAWPRSAALGGTRNFRILFLFFLKSNFVQSYPIITILVAMKKFPYLLCDSTSFLDLIASICLTSNYQKLTDISVNARVTFTVKKNKRQKSFKGWMKMMRTNTHQLHKILIMKKKRMMKIADLINEGKRYDNYLSIHHPCRSAII